MSPKRIDYLVGLYFGNNITEMQQEEMAGYIAQLSDQQIKELLEKAWLNQGPDNLMPEEISEKIIGTLLKSQNPKEPSEIVSLFYTNRTKSTWWRVVAAAACVLALLAIFLWPAGSKKQPVATNKVQQKQPANDVQPGSQKAVLVLANGTQIVLDSASNGILAQQGNTQVKKLANGKIVYSTDGHPVDELVYNTMSTPTGGIYQLVLPDETKVWLNSASSIRYPTSFDTGERRVAITGEVYFEVTKNEAQPFIVTVNNSAEIKVLGTHFNVNAYDDENEIKTTLMEGAVNVSQGINSAALIPGQQAQINKNGAIKKIKDVDLEEAIAWKNGNFLFNSAGLQTVLRQAARWYSLEIVYEGKIPDDKFSGQVSRSVSLSNLLKWMQWSDVHFKLDGRKLIIKN